MSRTVQIVLPGLFDLPLYELEPQLLDQKLPHLNRFLRLATAKRNQAYTIDAILGNALAGHDSVQAEHAGLPMAQAFAASAATEGTSPSDNALGSAWYRREIVGVHLRRLLSGQE